LRGVGDGCQNRPVLTIGVVALGVTDVQRAAEFWRQALGYELRADGFGGWATVLAPPDGASYPDDPDFVVLADPDGNRFCIVDLGHEDG